MPDQNRYSWLQQAATTGSVIITASRRLARDLGASHAEQQLAAGESAWETPQIAYWADWLSRLHAQADDPASVPRRLDGFSAGILWERCLRGRLPDSLLGFGATARQAAIAWQRLCDWDVSIAELLATARSEDEKLFARAAADYQEQLDEGHWIDGPGMAALVSELVAMARVPVPARLVLAGFDRQSPAMQKVLAALESAGAAVTVVAVPDRRQSLQLADFGDIAAEMRAAGAWARSVLDEDPGARVGIVAPDLESKAAALTELVREGLVPGWQFGGAHHEKAVNVSYGRRLSDYPAIAVALLMLRWMCRGLRGREISVLLRSACTGDFEPGRQSRMELALRGLPDREWKPGEFLQAFCCDEATPGKTGFPAIVGIIAATGEQHRDRASPAENVRRIDDCLKACGWPGEGSLDSTGFQLINRWRELLNEFARIETVLPELSLAEAVQRISSLASETLWQPESDHGVVQLLGALEAAGMEFDALWVGSLDASQWPPASRPSPFISNTLQRERGMPDATPADTLAFSRRVLERLTGAAGRCVLSWSRLRDDAELTASTLLDELQTAVYDGPADPGWFGLCLAGSAPVTVIDDDVVRPVAAEERVAGGAYTLQRQFREPFSAFAAGRLGIRPAEPFVNGLSPGMRGSIIHNALHNLMAGKVSRDEIRRWDESECSRRIGSAIDSALGMHHQHADTVLLRMIALERDRLRTVVGDFLKCECERVHSFAVSEVESSLEYVRAGLRLGFRIDRIDRLEDGRLLIIDYKTGAPKTFVTQDGELKDVQLVIYADALDAEIGGLVFINVDSREISYKGKGGGWNAAEEAGWTDTLNGWRRQVHDAVEGLAAGDIRINIRQTAGEARALAILSRIEEQRRGH